MSLCQVCGPSQIWCLSGKYVVLVRFETCSSNLKPQSNVMSLCQICSRSQIGCLSGKFVVLVRSTVPYARNVKGV